MNIGAVVGRLTKDMEFMPYTSQSTGKTGYKARGTIAVDRKGTGKNGQKETDFVPVQSWITEAQKENYHGKYMKKGALISVNGYIRVENYQDKETQQNRTFTVVQGDMQFVSAPSNNGNKGGNQNGQGQGQGQNQGFEPSFEPSFEPGGFQEIDSDDIPF